MRSQSGSCPAGRRTPPEGSREYTAGSARVKARRGPRRDALSGGSVLARAGGRNAACRRGSRARPGARTAGRARCTGSPSRLTPPPAIRRRASLRDATPEPVGEQRRQVHRRRRAMATVGMSSGARRSRTTRLKCSSARSPGPRPVEAVGDQPGRGGACRRRGGRAGGGSPGASSRYHSASAASGMLIVRPNCSSGGSATPMWLPSDLLIFRSPSMPEQERHRHDDLGRAGRRRPGSRGPASG